MIAIRKLVDLSSADLRRLVVGYTSDATYRVTRSESEPRSVFTLELVPLTVPYRKRYDHLDAGTVADYQRMASLGYSFGAYDGGQCVGLGLAEPSHWNKTLFVHELHVADTHQRRGIGRQLVEALAEKGRANGFRILLCETQNTNFPAIHFYRQTGFHLEGFDLSHYRNDDYPDGEIAVFMKRKLVP